MQAILGSALRRSALCAACTVALAAVAQAQTSDAVRGAPSEANHFIATPEGWVHPMTSWGDPDIQGVWSNSNEINVPFERPAEFGMREYLNRDEVERVLAARNQDREVNVDNVGGIGTGAGPGSSRLPVWASGLLRPCIGTGFATPRSRGGSLAVRPPQHPSSERNSR